MIQVKAGRCPVRGRLEFGLWDDLFPIVPANVYLRSLGEDDAEPGGVKTRAHQLVPFFRYLAGRRFSEEKGYHRTDRRIDFSDLTRQDVEGFREDLKRRIRATTIRDSHAKRFAEEKPEPRIASARALRHGTADRYLMAAYQLCLYWGVRWVLGLPAETIQIRGTGFLGHLHNEIARRPKPFKVRTPRKFRRRRPKGLPLDVYEEVWAFLEGAQPEYPEIIDVAPQTARERQRMVGLERTYDSQMMLHLRNKAIWAFLMATGFRKGELVRICTDDLYQDVDTGSRYVRLIDRDEHGHISSLKSGEGRVYIGHTARFLQHIDAWTLRGRALADEQRQVNGLPEHRMLFTNADGGPLTLDGVEALFEKIDKALGIRARGHSFSPHVCRHTINSILKSAGVELAFRQWFLRHSRPDTTEGYGYVFEGALQRAIRSYHDGEAGVKA